MNKQVTVLKYYYYTKHNDRTVRYSNAFIKKVDAEIWFKKWTTNIGFILKRKLTLKRVEVKIVEPSKN